MSIHLVECAARLNLPASTKLALMAFADSADRVTRIAYPGLDHVRQWSGLGRSRAAEVVADLVEAGLLQKHRSAAWRRRAEYVVFPRGCCPDHAPIPDDAESDPPDPMANAGPGSGTADPDTLTDSGPPDPTDQGSAASAPPDPAATQGSGRPDTTASVGSGAGSDSYRTPSLTPTTPMAEGAAQPQGARPAGPPPDRDEHGPLHPTCPEHRAAADPPPCRRCGNWREEFERAEVERTAAARRAASAELLANERRAKHDTAHVDRRAHLAKVRAEIRETTGARP